MTFPTAGNLSLWPSPEYDAQLARLRGALGETIYIVEARMEPLHVSARNSGTAHELLAIIDFPRPDPARHLYPHLLLLDDGRGINLGRILRVSRHRPYAPDQVDRVFENSSLAEHILPRERSLSAQRIRHIARSQLGELTGTTRVTLPARGQIKDN